MRGIVRPVGSSEYMRSRCMCCMLDALVILRLKYSHDLGVCDYRRGMDGILNLLTICIDHSELQVIALLPISTLQITPREVF
jgi:hypothetical protein